MSSIAEFLNSVFRRPLVGWGALSLASGCFLALLQGIKLWFGVDDSLFQIAAISAAALFFIATAFFLVVALSQAAGAARRGLGSATAEAATKAKLTKLSPEAKNILLFLALRNERQISMMHDFPGQMELREAGLLNLIEIYNGACRYSVDHKLAEYMQENLSFMNSIRPGPELVQGLLASMKNASEATQNIWMSH